MSNRSFLLLFGPAVFARRGLVMLLQFVMGQLIFHFASSVVFFRCLNPVRLPASVLVFSGQQLLIIIGHWLHASASSVDREQITLVRPLARNAQSKKG